MEKKKINFTRLVESLRWYEKEYKGSIMDEEDKKTFSLAADVLEDLLQSVAEWTAKYEAERDKNMDAVPVVFINDPFHVVYQAFKELYPDKECEILFDYNVETTDTHERVKGVTIFPDDGSIPQIRIDCEQTIDQISGILAHELAHVALGKPEWDDRELDHGEDFEKVLDAIFDRFNELQGFCADGERSSDGKQ